MKQLDSPSGLGFCSGAGDPASDIVFEWFLERVESVGILYACDAWSCLKSCWLLLSVS